MVFQERIHDGNFFCSCHILQQKGHQVYQLLSFEDSIESVHIGISLLAMCKHIVPHVNSSNTIILG